MRERLIQRKGIVERAFANRKKEYREIFNKPIDYNILYKHISDYSNSRRYEDAILWQDFIVENFLKDSEELFNQGIRRSYRKNNIFVKHHVSNNNDETREDVQCRILFEENRNQETIIGELIDYQTPLRATIQDLNFLNVPLDQRNNQGLGKIDLLSILDNTLNIIEYKIPNSNEPLLRAVLEVMTYYYQVIKNLEGNDIVYVLAANTKKILNDNMTMSIVVPKIAYENAHPYSFELIENNKIKCYTFNNNKDYKSIIQLSLEEINIYKELAIEKYLQVPDDAKLKLI